MDTRVVDRNFNLGFQSDVARDQLPRGAAYRMKDWLPQLDGPLRGRGGWDHASADLNNISACTGVSGVAWAPFQTYPQVVAVADNGKLFKVETFAGAGGVYVATTSFTGGITHEPFFHKDLMILLENRIGSAKAPQKYYYSGSTATLGTLGGTPPFAYCGASWGDYMILANGTVGATAFPTRAWWSDPALPEVWTTGSSFFDMPEEVVRVVPLTNIILFYGYANTWGLTGDTPPPGGNMALRIMFAGNGVMDGRTIATDKDSVYWANQGGIWKTDGGVLTDLTYRCGIKEFWRSLVSTFNLTTGWSASGDVIYGHYIVTVLNTSDVEVGTVVIDLEREIAFEFTNFPAAMYARRASGVGTANTSGAEELFFANVGSPFVEKVSTLWSPTGQMADGDGDSVLPVLETPFYKMGSSVEKRIRRAWFTYDLRGASPALQVKFATSPESGVTYETAEDTLPVTTTQARVPVYVNRKALGVGFKITQVGLSTDTRLGEIEIEGHANSSERR